MVGRVQELLTTAHDGCKLDRVLKNDNVKRMEKKCRRRGEERRREERRTRGSVAAPLIKGLDS